MADRRGDSNPASVRVFVEEDGKCANGEQWLLGGCCAAELVERDGTIDQVCFGPHQAIAPADGDQQPVLKDFGSSLRVGATNEDDAGGGGAGLIGHGSACRSLEGESVGPLMRFDESERSLLELVDGAVVEAFPDRTAERTVEPFDAVLEALFHGRCKDRDDAVAQGGADHRADASGLVVTLEDRVVVELDIAGKAVATPAFSQPMLHEGDGHSVGRPSVDQASMLGDHGEGIEQGTASDPQILDEVAAIHFDAALLGPRQVPPFGRCRVAQAPSTVQRPATLQDPSDGADARRREPPRGHLTMDGGGTVLAQRTSVLEPRTNLQDVPLGRQLGPARRRDRSGRSISQVDAIKPLPTAAMEPTLDGAQAHAIASGGGPHRSTAADSQHN